MDSLVQSLCEDIISNSEFDYDYTQLLSTELKYSENQNGLNSEQIKKLSESAAILALSDNSQHQHMAFKIVIFLMNQYGKQYKSIPFLAELILCRMGDLPTIKQIIDKKQGIDYFSFFNSSDSEIFDVKFPEILLKKIFNQFTILEKEKWSLTNFQSEVLRQLLSGKNIAYSAPTSAGKSFIIHNYVLWKTLTSEKFTSIIIVPTRALIEEVRKSITEKLNQFESNSEDIIISASINETNKNYLEESKKKIFILTPERLQHVLSKNWKISPNLLVIDEAQKIKDEGRGVILENTINEILNMDSKLQIVLISPFMKNLHNFKQIFNIKNLETIPSSKSPVGRNIFFIDFKGKLNVDVSIFSEELQKKIELETIKLDSKLPNTQYGTKAWIAANLLEGHGHTLVYCNRPKECKDVAKDIAKNIQNFEVSYDLQEAIEFLKKNIHPQYDLIDFLKKGIGYHYGKMPAFVRFLIQNLFENGKINYLCCTSTLLEGVNLPAKNIVLYLPKKGMNQEMDKHTIKNLIGRVGRLGKDYYGNIYCVDAHKWKEGEEAFKEDYEEVESSMEKTVTVDMSTLISHLDEFNGLRHGKKNVQVVATNLIMNQIKDPEQKFLENLMKKYPSINNEELKQVSSLLEEIEKEILVLDKNVILRNKTIDPRLQVKLYEELKKRTRPPTVPFPEDKELSRKLFSVFELIFKFLFTQDEKKHSITDCTHIGADWIHQRFYKQILENRIYYQEKFRIKNELDKKGINKLIDDVDGILDNDLRYHYSRGLQCYWDVLDTVIKENNLGLKSYSNLHENLELGLNNKRAYLLLNLGFSRHTSIVLSKLLPEDISDLRECKSWIKTHSMELRESFSDKNDWIWLKEFDQLIPNKDI